jgi:hypothetical protein
LCHVALQMSMPGMMDTVLNVGLNDVVVEGLAKQVNDRFAWDCYRRLLQVRLVLALLRLAWHCLSAPQCAQHGSGTAGQQPHRVRGQEHRACC